MKPIFMQFKESTTGNDEENVYQKNVKHYFGDSLAHFRAALTRYENNWYSESDVNPAFLQIVTGRKEAILKKLTLSKNQNAKYAIKNLMSAALCIEQLLNYLVEVETQINRDEYNHQVFGWLARLFNVQKPSLLFMRHFQTLRRQLIEEEYLLLKVMVSEVMGNRNARGALSNNQADEGPLLSEKQFFLLLQAIHQTKVHLDSIQIYASSDGQPAYNLPFIKEVRGEYHAILLKQCGFTPQLCEDAQSWFRGRRARAQLVFLKARLSQRLRGKITPLAEFKAYDEVHVSALKVFKSLNPIWHWQSRRRLHEWHEHIQCRKAEVAKVLLAEWLNQIKTQKYEQNEQLIFIASLPNHIQLVFSQFQSWLTNAESVEEKSFVEAAETLMDFCTIPKIRQGAWLRDIVSCNIAPRVNSTNIAAYRLVYRFNKTAAFEIAKPNNDDVFKHLTDEQFWDTDKDKAINHLAFLLGKTSIAQFAHFMLQRHWLLEVAPIAVLQRLAKIAEAFPALIQPKDKLLLLWSVDAANQGTALASLHNALLTAARQGDTAAWLKAIELLYAALKLMTTVELSGPLALKLRAALTDTANILKACITTGHLIQSRYLLNCMKILLSPTLVEINTAEFLRVELGKIQQKQPQITQSQLTTKQTSISECNQTNKTDDSPSVQLFIAVTDTLNLIAVKPRRTVHQLKGFEPSKETLLRLATEQSALSQSQQQLLFNSIMAITDMPIITEKLKKFLQLLTLLLSNCDRDVKKIAIQHFFSSEEVRSLIKMRGEFAASNDTLNFKETNQLTA